MKLYRNETADGRGKYGLINNRKLSPILAQVGDSHNARDMDDVHCMKIREAVKLLEDEGILDWGIEGSPSEFFVIKLRDAFASAALYAYCLAAKYYDEEYAMEVSELLKRAGPCHPNCKMPD